MDEKELKEIFEFLQGAGANPQLCDTEVPYFEASVRAGLPTENFAEEAFVEMMSLPRKMLASTPAMMKQRFRDGDIVVARIGDGYTVKCYYEDDEGKHWLVAQNKEKENEYRPILLEEQENVQLYGVVAVPEWKVRRAIREIGKEIEVNRLWFAVYRKMTELGVVDDGDVKGFCDMVKEEVPNHGHLPVVDDLQRLDVLSFTKAVVLWDENDAPVKGKRFKLYKEIAQKTELLLLK